MVYPDIETQAQALERHMYWYLHYRLLDSISWKRVQGKSEKHTIQGTPQWRSQLKPNSEFRLWESWARTKIYYLKKIDISFRIYFNYSRIQNHVRHHPFRGNWVYWKAVCTLHRAKLSFDHPMVHCREVTVSSRGCGKWIKRTLPRSSPARYDSTVDCHDLDPIWPLQRYWDHRAQSLNPQPSDTENKGRNQWDRAIPSFFHSNCGSMCYARHTLCWLVSHPLRLSDDYPSSPFEVRRRFRGSTKWLKAMAKLLGRAGHWFVQMTFMDQW